MFDTLTVLQGTKLRKAVLATASAVVIAAAGASANAAEFYFYGDVGDQATADAAHTGDPMHLNNQNYLTTPGPYTGNIGVNVGTTEVYGDALGSAATVGAAAFTSNTGIGYGSTANAYLIENTRAANDLGLGVKKSGFYDSTQTLELAKYEVIRLDLGSNYLNLTDVVAWFSSIDGGPSGEMMQVATSNSDSVPDWNSVDWASPGFTLDVGAPKVGGVPTYGEAYNSTAGCEPSGCAPVNLSTLFGGTTGKYLFFRENLTDCSNQYKTTHTGYPNCNDDVLLMQLAYNAGTPTTGIPEPGALAIFGFGVIGMGFARRRRQASLAVA